MKTNLGILNVVIVMLTSMTGLMQDPHSKIVIRPSQITESKSTPEINRIMPEKLRGLALSIQGSHFPNPTYATFEDGMYVWKHDTSVKSMTEDLQLTSYGSYIYTDNGWILRVTYTPADFEKTYHCKGALLKKGKIYTDPTSWRKSESLVGGDAMWFYIAQNKVGREFKGTALVETEAKLLLKNTSIGLPKKMTPRSNNSEIIALDVQKSSVKWTGYGEVGSYSLTGTVNLKSGNFKLKNKKIISGSIVIDLNTIDHSDNQLKAHLKGEDFFEVSKYPTATLTIKRTIQNSKNEIEVFGNLTIKKTTQPIGFKMTQNQQQYSGKITLDRTAFGVRYGSKNFFDNLGDQAIKNNFDLEFKLISQ